MDEVREISRYILSIYFGLGFEYIEVKLYYILDSIVWGDCVCWVL